MYLKKMTFLPYLIESIFAHRVHKREFDLKIALFTRDEVKKSTGNKIWVELERSKVGTVVYFLNFLFASYTNSNSKMNDYLSYQFPNFISRRRKRWNYGKICCKSTTTNKIIQRSWGGWVVGKSIIIANSGMVGH